MCGSYKGVMCLCAEGHQHKSQLLGREETFQAGDLLKVKATVKIAQPKAEGQLNTGQLKPKVREVKSRSWDW